MIEDVRHTTVIVSLPFDFWAHRLSWIRRHLQGSHAVLSGLWRASPATQEGMQLLCLRQIGTMAHRLLQPSRAMRAIGNLARQYDDHDEISHVPPRGARTRGWRLGTAVTSPANTSWHRMLELGGLHGQQFERRLETRQRRHSLGPAGQVGPALQVERADFGEGHVAIAD